MLAKNRWELTRSRILAGAVIQYEAHLAIKLKNDAQRADAEAKQAPFTSACFRSPGPTLALILIIDMTLALFSGCSFA